MSPAGLGTLDNSLSGNQMLIKRKLHSIEGQQNRKETLAALVSSEGSATGEGWSGGGQEGDSSLDVRKGDEENKHQRQRDISLQRRS